MTSEPDDRVGDTPTADFRRELVWPKREIDATARALVRAGNRSTDDSISQALQMVRLAQELTEELDEIGVHFPADAPELGTVLGALWAALDLTRQAGESIDNHGWSVRYGEVLSRAGIMLNDALMTWVVFLRDQLGETKERVSPFLDLFAERLRARRLVTETEGARDQARQAAGTTGESVLAAHFNGYARRERRAANVLRGLSVLALLIITALAAVLVMGDPPSDLSTTQELTRLSLTLPLAALAAYFAREASQHRAAAQWAAELEVQLLTVDAYTAPLSDALRDQLRVELGRRVFTTPGPGASRAQGDVGQSKSIDPTGLLDRVTELVQHSNSTARETSPIRPTEQQP